MIKTFEAVLALIILLGTLLLVSYSGTFQHNELDDLKEYSESVMISLALDQNFRTNVIATQSSVGRVKNVLATYFLATPFALKVCDLNNDCVGDSITTRQKMIVTNYLMDGNGTAYSPKIVRLYTWLLEG